MLIDAEVDRYLDQAAALMAQNVESFFASNGIGRAELEVFALRPFENRFDSFYVSTVARGLAGSRSDVDFILVSNALTAEVTTLSNMLFHAGRRVGVKLVNRQTLEESLAVLHEVTDNIAAGQFVNATDRSKRISVGWQDLERLINGVSFSSGAKYLYHLPWLCRWTVVNTLQEFLRQLIFVRLALASGIPTAASAYAFGAIESAMDAIMAACGQVQSNTKWTFERWRRFTPTIQARKALEAVALVAQARDVLARPLVKSSGIDIAKALTSLQAFLCIELMPCSQLGNARLDVSEGAHRAPFLPGAESIGSARVAAVVSTATLAQVLGATNAEFVALDRGVARDTLRLLQVGALSCTMTQSVA
jgi:hypothetical protein